MLETLIDIFLHLDKHLSEVIQDYGVWTYAVLFTIIFCETGLVVTPVLPGDSLLFAVGTFTAPPDAPLNFWLVCLLLIVAAVLGDAVNYSIGKFLGPKVLKRDGRFLKRAYLERTHQFFEKYGGKTIIIARFVPIVRTFAPFMAGVGSMSYWQFASYNVIGAVLWIVLLVLAGRLFNGIPFVRDHFSMVVLAIVAISLLPGVFEWWRHRQEQKATAKKADAGDVVAK